jgi:hypothetical protein
LQQPAPIDAPHRLPSFMTVSPRRVIATSRVVKGEDLPEREGPLPISYTAEG